MSKRDRKIRGHKQPSNPPAERRPLPEKPGYDPKWLPLLIVAAGILAYANSFGGVFLFDDTWNIVEQQRIRQLWPAWDLLQSRRPVVSLSLAVNYALGELNIWGYHLVNLIVHLLTALTLFALVNRTLIHIRVNAATYLALSTALLWVVHPLTTQSVTYIIQRGEALMALFYLLTLYCVLRGATTRRTHLWYIAAVLACALGMASKAVMVTAPLAVLLYDRVFLTQSWRETLRKRWLLYLGLLASGLVLVSSGIVQTVLNFSGKGTATVGFAYKNVTPLEYALSQAGVILHYLRLSLWPNPLCMDYMWNVAKTSAAIIPPVLVLLLLLAATLWALWNKPPIGFAAAFFFLVLAPTSSFIPIKDLAFEHRMYLPLACVIVLIVSAGWSILSFISRRLALLPAATRLIAIVVVAVVAGALAYGTIRRNHDYYSEVTMWSKIVAQRPDNYRAHDDLGRSLRAVGRLDEAFAHFAESLRLNPNYHAAHNNLGNALMKRRQFAEATKHLEQAIRLNPKFDKAYSNLGAALAQQGKFNEAIPHLKKAIELNPHHSGAHSNLGNVFAALGDNQKALEHYLEALRITDDSAEVHNNLAGTLFDLNRLNEAIEHFRIALRLNPSYIEAYCNLATALMKQGRFDEAIYAYQAALKVSPGDPRAAAGLKAAQARRSPRNPEPGTLLPSVRSTRNVGWVRRPDMLILFLSDLQARPYFTISGLRLTYGVAFHHESHRSYRHRTLHCSNPSSVQFILFRLHLRSAPIAFRDQ